MFSRRAVWLSLLFVSLAASAFASGPISDWIAPQTWSPPREFGAKGAHLLASAPVPFTPLPPCRGADTRGFGFGGQYGPPSLKGGAARNFTVTGICGVPANAQAVSFNFTVTNDPTFGDIRVFPAGATPLVSTLNWNSSSGSIANAAVVPLGDNGAITVLVDGPGPVDLIFDINGFYSDQSDSSFSFFSSSGYGVLGATSVNGFAGVYGLARLGGTYGVFGQNYTPGSDTSDVVGVYGEASDQTGRNFGVKGLSRGQSRSVGVYGAAGGGTPSGILVSSSSVGVMGEATDGHGVAGNSKNNFGVRGTSQNNSAVAGFNYAAGSPNPRAAGYLGYNSLFGVWADGNLGASGAKSFIDPHPNDPTREIAYAALEGPEVGTYFRGRGRVRGGAAVISVPEHFRMVTDDEGLTVQITPIGKAALVAVMSVDLNSIVVESTEKELEFYYVINGVRKAFKDWQVIAENTHYRPDGPDARMAGAYTPEQRRALIATGIYNEDGTVNLETAERLGWAKAWRDPAVSGRAQIERRHALSATAPPNP